MSRTLTQKQVDDIVRLYKENHVSVEGLSMRFGRKPEQIRRILRKNGIGGKGEWLV